MLGRAQHNAVGRAALRLGVGSGTASSTVSRRRHPSWAPHCERAVDRTPGNTETLAIAAGQLLDQCGVDTDRATLRELRISWGSTFCQEAAAA